MDRMTDKPEVDKVEEELMKGLPFFSGRDMVEEDIREIVRTAYKLGKENTYKNLVHEGKFTTSMNRKVCYEAGYKQAIEEIQKKVFGFFESKFEKSHVVTLNNERAVLITEGDLKQSLQNIFNSPKESNENETSVIDTDESMHGLNPADIGDSPKPRFATDSGESPDALCECGHRNDEHDRFNQCAGCPCENPNPLWFRIIDIDELLSNIEKEFGGKEE